jgi:hypothetical protein
MGELHDVDQTDVSLPALYATYVVAVQVGQFRQFLLRQPPREPQLADSFTEDNARVGIRHAAIIGT